MGHGIERELVRKHMYMDFIQSIGRILELLSPYTYYILSLFEIGLCKEGVLYIYNVGFVKMYVVQSKGKPWVLDCFERASLLENIVSALPTTKLIKLRAHKSKLFEKAISLRLSSND